MNNCGILEQNLHHSITPTPCILSDIERRKREYEKKWGVNHKKRSIVEFNLENMDGESSSQVTTSRNKPLPISQQPSNDDIAF